VSYQDFWGTSNWGFAFGEPGKYYTLGYHIGQDILTKIDGLPTTVDIPALIGGRVARVGFSAQIGYFVVLAVGALFHTYCHLRPSTLPKMGNLVAGGQTVAQSGSGSDALGTASGPHLHFVVSTAITTAHSPVASQVIDPRPVIRGQLASFAGGGLTPIEEEEEEEMPRIKTTPEGAQWLVGKNDRIHLDENSSALWNRFVDGDPLGDRLLTAQMDQCILMQRAVDIPKTSTEYPTATDLAKALAPLLANGGVDEAVLAKQIREVLSPEFAKVNANIDDQPVNFTIAPKA
jgi:hypothetical protein